MSPNPETHQRYYCAASGLRVGDFIGRRYSNPIRIAWERVHGVEYCDRKDGLSFYVVELEHGARASWASRWAATYAPVEAVVIYRDRELPGPHATSDLDASVERLLSGGKAE